MSDCSNWRGDRIKAAVEERAIIETNERVDVSG